MTGQGIYCKGASGGLEAVTKKYLIDYIESGEVPPEVCDQEEITHIVLDAKSTAEYEKIWYGEFNIEGRNKATSVKQDYKDGCYHLTSPDLKKDCFKKLHLSYGVELVFVGTSSGITRYGVIAEPLSNPDFLSVNAETIKNLYYQRAVLGWQAGYNYIFSLYNEENIDNFERAAVTMSTPEVINRGIPGKHEVVAAVVGLQMKYDNFHKVFKYVTEQCTGPNCEFTCAHTEYLNCYLVDNNGYIMASNLDNTTAEFLGKVDGALMKVLIEEEVFNKITFKDYQGVCQIYNTEEGSSASFIVNPIRTVFSSITWFLTETVLFLTEFNVYNWFSRSSKSAYAFSDGPLPYADVIGYEACDKLVTTYSLNLKTLTQKSMSVIDSITGCGKCGEYSGSYMARWINDTNLLMVVAASNCTCADDQELTIRPEKILYNESEMCKRLWKLQQSPSQGGKCFDSNLEVDDKCSGQTSNISFSLVSLVFFIILTSALS